MSDTSVQGIAVAGLKFVAVQVTEVDPNPWNPNEMDDETFAKERRSIRDNGFVDPITVRPMGSRWQLIDGEHRWRAAAAEGMTELPATNLGNISDHQAHKLTIIYNELRGRSNPDKLASLVRLMVADENLASLAETLPLSEAEMNSLLYTLDFGWEATGLLITDSEHRPLPEQIGGTRSFKFGLLNGQVERAVCDGIVAVFKSTSARLGTTDPTAVFREWLTMLGGAEVVSTSKRAVARSEAEDAQAATGVPAPVPESQQQATLASDGSATPNSKSKRKATGAAATR